MRRVLFCLVVLSSLLLFLAPTQASAQTVSGVPRITQAVDESRRVTLKGNTHPLALAQFDAGAAPADLPMDRMLLVLKRSPEQQLALVKLLDDLHDTASANYHKWLTPDEFGRRFGPADADIEAVNAWLMSHGFRITKVARGRSVIEFSGTAAQVERAFHTTMHKYVVRGESHWANSGDMQIPAALTPVVAGVFTLHDFRKQPMIHIGARVPAKFERGSPPQVTFTNPTEHALGPADYAKIYNINPVYTSGIDGTGVTIGVVGRSEIFISDVQDFRNAFGLGGSLPQIVNNGASPGNLGGGEEAEAVLDATWSNAIAPGANVNLVVSASTNTTDGVDLSELYIVDNNAADIMTESFGSCEAAFTSSEASAVSLLAEQAAAQGITYMVSTGDTGAPGCDNLSETVATGPISVNLLASTPFNIAVGGTMFNENGQDSKYWGTSPPLAETALSYIPENVWNESCTVAQCGSSNANIAAGGGGASAFFTKPSWQSGVSGIPTANARNLPDISLTAALHDAYLLCLQSSCSQGSIFFIGGTSASTPAFAGIMALVNQKMGVRQGQANYVLYKLAAAQTYSQCNGSKTTAPPASTCIFNDVTVGNNAVPGEAGFGTSTAKYQSGVAYDLATGLGSVNVANLVSKWNTATFRATTTTLALSPTTTITHGSSVNVNITVAPGSGTGVPTGDVSLRNDLPVSGLDGAAFSLSGGTVASTTNLLRGGSYHVIAHYAGDATFAPSDSAPVAITVSPEASTTALSIFGFDARGNLIPFGTQVYGDPAYLRADVSGLSGHGTPSGNVVFKEGGVDLIGTSFNLNTQGNATTAQGIFNIPAGAHSVVAAYNGDSSFNASNSPPVAITVTKAPTTITLTTSSTNIGATDTVTLTATVKTTSGGRAPSGIMTFFSGGTPISNPNNPFAVSGTDGSGSVQTGAFTAAQSAAGLVTTLPPGQDSITAQYSGDGNYAGITSSAVTVNVDADFTIASSAPTLAVTQGASGTLKISIVGQAHYSGTINFTAASCTGLPRESSCSFSPASVTGSGDTTLTIKTTAPHAASLNGLPWTTGFGVTFAAVFLLGGASRKPRYRRAAFGFILCASLLGIGACGGGGSGPPPDPGTPKGTSTVTVTATSGTLPPHKATITLTVQ
jgi:hypothetical protein